MSRPQKMSLAALPLALLAGVAIVRIARRAVAAAPPPPVVTVATPLVRPVAEWDDYSGRFEASKSVEVRPRVSGAIVGVHFTDGSVVHQGQLLFTIDPRPFVAALAEARAAVAGARSDLALAQSRSWPGNATARGRCRVAQRRRSAAGARAGRPRRRLLPPRRAFNRAHSTSASRRSGRRSPAASPTAESMPAISSRAVTAAAEGDAADDHQCARSDLLQLRRVRGPVPEGPPGARKRRRAVRGRDQAAGREPTIAGTAGSTSPTTGSTRGRARSGCARWSPTRRSS